MSQTKKLQKLLLVGQMTKSLDFIRHCFVRCAEQDKCLCFSHEINSKRCVVHNIIEN